MKKVLYALIAIFVFGNATMAQVPSYVPTNGLVGYWPFNGNANDVSGNGNNGIVIGAILSSNRFGVINHAYSFDGNQDYVSVSNSSSIQITGPITLSIWALPNVIYNQPTTTFGGRLINKMDVGVSYPGYMMDLGANVNSIPGGYENKARFIGANENVFTTPVFNNPNIWYHIVVVYDLSSLIFYVNGQINSIVALSGQLGSNNLPLLFGGHNQQNNSWFNGKLDDIGIWNRALTQQEITNLYRSCNDSIITAEPTNTSVGLGTNAQFTTVSANGSSYQWQTNPLNTGWMNVPSNSYYSGVNTSTIGVSNVSVSNHNQAFRSIVNSNGCADTSKVVYLKVADTCLTTVTDTLIIQTKVGLPTPNIANNILIYPNPAKDRITIDNGNYTVMSGYSIKIQNSLGQQVFNSAITQAQFNIDLSTWTGKGIYYVRLLDASGNVVITRKILLQ